MRVGASTRLESLLSVALLPSLPAHPIPSASRSPSPKGLQLDLLSSPVYTVNFVAL